MDQPIVTPWYLDKAFWAMLLAPLFLFINAKFGLSLDAVQILALVLPVVAYIVGHKWKTATLQAAVIAAGATAAVAPAAKLNG